MAGEYGTTVDDVKAVVEVDPSFSDAQVQVFIDVASRVVARHCVDDDATNTDADLKLIETWLSAHFYGIRDPRVRSEAAKGVSQSIATRIDLGLNQTEYGQQAILLDASGGLSTWQDSIQNGSAGRSTGINWLGTEPGDE